jgi:hypothetical protein
MDYGFVTHAVHANSRLVYLPCSPDDKVSALTAIGPPDSGVYPPGPAFLVVLVDDVPSEGLKIMVGSGRSPPTDPAALQK